MVASFTSEEAAMNIRMLSLALGCSALFFSSAQAAITVIGPGPAQICYQAAEMEASASDYMTYCNQALASVLDNDERAATFIHRGVLRLSVNDFDSAATDFKSGLALNS